MFCSCCLCRSYNECYTCNYCVNIEMDSITGACPESCYCAPDENRTTTVSPNDWNSTCVVPWDRYQACTNHSGCDADQYCDEFRCVARSGWAWRAGGEQR